MRIKKAKKRNEREKKKNKKNVSRQSRIGVACPVVLLYFSLGTRPGSVRVHVCACTEVYSRRGKRGGSAEMAEKLAPFNRDFHRD